MSTLSQLQRRVANPSLALSDLPPLLQRIYSARGITALQQLDFATQALHPPELLAGLPQAVQLLYQAFVHQQKIIVVGDFDADGASSSALAVLVLRAFGHPSVEYLVPNRFAQGYGLTPAVVEQAQQLGGQCLITVDNGIASHQGVALAKQYQMTVIITDHHLPAETLPAADAIVNPNLAQCHFPSKALAGVGVVFYLMLALRRYLREQQWFVQQAIKEVNLANYLDLVALGTVADLVPLDSNNRILVQQGLLRIRAGSCRPGISALLAIAKRQRQQVLATDLAFAVGPRLNAAGRLDDMSLGISLLLTDDLQQAEQLATQLDQLNQNRKQIEQEMTQAAWQLCEQLAQSANDLPAGLVLHQPQWHEGVIGILASRVKERFHRPVIAFAPTQQAGIWKGSGRSVSGLHLRDTLALIDSRYPQLLEKFGGHAMAAGMTVRQENLAQLTEQFAAIVAEQLSAEQLAGVIMSDGELTHAELTLDNAQLLRQAAPWGQAFPEPLFDGEFQLLQQKLINNQHLKVTVATLDDKLCLDGIAFNVDSQYWPDARCQRVHLVYKLAVNEFRGNRSLQLMIEKLWPVV